MYLLVFKVLIYLTSNIQKCRKLSLNLKSMFNGSFKIIKPFVQGRWCGFSLALISSNLALSCSLACLSHSILVKPVPAGTNLPTTFSFKLLRYCFAFY